MSKYTPLQNYLSGLPAHQNDVTLTFEQIEGILKSPLPYSAYESLTWWTHEKEGNHVDARAWFTAGWQIDTVDMEKKWVRFIRQ
jgi:hypothetical protein